MIEYFKKRPMLIAAVACIFISLIGYYAKGLLLLLSIFLIASFIALFIGKKAKGIFIVSVSILMLLSVFRVNFNILNSEELDDTTHKANIVVTKEIYSISGTQAIYGEVSNSKTLNKGTEILFYNNARRLELGQSFDADFELSVITGDYVKSSVAESVYLKAWLKNYTLRPQNDDFVLTAVKNIRNYIKTALFRNTDYREASTLCALIFGEKGYFSDEFEANVRKAGVSHVMVVSGMHLSIFAAIFTYLIEKVFYNRYLKAVCIALVVLFLITLCGFTMSMLRAGVTYLLMAVGLLLLRRGVAENTLGAAVTFILIGSPYSVFSIGFCLSVLSTFGILAVALPIIRYINENDIIKQKFLLGITSAVIITLSALLLTLPLVIYTFESVSLVSVITNLFISWAVTSAVWLAVIALFVNAIFPLIAKPLFFLCNSVTKYINNTINFMGDLSFAEVKVAKEWSFLCVCVILLVFWLLIACKKRLDMIKLIKMRKKIIKEGGGKLKWL